jgi:transcriptional/translational regulatory protein YebC/TACO1
LQPPSDDESIHTWCQLLLQEESELVYKAAAPVEVDDEAFDKCEALMERLLELDDVDSVYSNCEGL